MAKRYIYNRVSGSKQDYDQQMHCIKTYLERQGISMERIGGEFTETEHGDTSYKERKLTELIKLCEAGDYIFVSELSRIGRSMTDVFEMVDICCKRGIIIIQCKDGTQIENVSIGGKAVLFALSLAAEIELANIRQRTRMKLDSIKEEIARNGGWVSKSGVWRTHLGSQKGDAARNRDMSAAQHARTKKATEARMRSAGYKWVSRQIAEGKTAKQIVEEFNRLHEISPETFCAPQGGELTYPAFARWKKYIMAEMEI